MSFIGAKEEGKKWEAGWFLDHEECERKTREIPQSLATTVNGKKYVKAGTPFPSNDGSCIGFVYEDVDVTSGNMPGSVVLSGTVIKSELPVELAGAAESALAGKFEFVATMPSITRPY